MEILQTQLLTTAHTIVTGGVVSNTWRERIDLDFVPNEVVINFVQYNCHTGSDFLLGLFCRQLNQGRPLILVPVTITAQAYQLHIPNSQPITALDFELLRFETDNTFAVANAAGYGGNDSFISVGLSFTRAPKKNLQ